MPSVSRENLSNTHAVLTVVLTKEELQPKLQAELKRIRQRVAIKGFRQGQAPAHMVKQLYGASMFMDMFQDMVNDELTNYLVEGKIDMLGQPVPSENQQKYTFNVDKPEDVYTLKYEIGFVPEFQIQGLDATDYYERYKLSDLDEISEKEMKNIEESNGERTDAADSILEGDIVYVQATELDGDALKPNGWSPRFVIAVKDVTDAALKADLLTKKKGDRLRFNARHIENNTDEKKYRKYILHLENDDNRTVGDWFEGEIEGVSRFTKKPVDEAYYQSYFGPEVTDRASAMVELKKGIEQFYDSRSSTFLFLEFKKRLLELNRFELPGDFLKKWLLYRNPELNKDAVEAEYSAFEENLRWDLLRSTIVKDNNLQVTDEDLRDRFSAKVRSYFGNNSMQIPDEIIHSAVDRMMRDEKSKKEEMESLEIDKLFDYIKSKVSFTDKLISSEELQAKLEQLNRRVQGQRTATEEEETIEELL